MPISADFPFESRFIDVLGVRMHYIEQGKGRPFLFLHGNPTWSYLWRNIIPPVANEGRCIAFDLAGFGKSDKPDMGYTFLEHYKYVEGFIDALGLKEVVLVGHDWGGVLAFYYALNHRENVKGMAFMETFPFTFTWDDFPSDFRIGFRLFRTPVIGHLLIMGLNLFIEKLIPASVYRGVSDSIHENYRKPFPTFRSRYPIYVWPNELPIEGRENKTFRAIKRIEDSLPGFSFPMLLFTCTPGGVIREEKVTWLTKTIQDLSVKDLGHGIHYVQENNPFDIAEGIIEWARKKGLVAGDSAVDATVPMGA
jgi:pimeloyl-ACP methyl ester carboxylesterase